MKIIALITAAGKGQRMQSPVAKQYMLLAGKPVLARTIEVFEACKEVDGIYLIVPQEEMTMVQQDIVEKYHFKKVLKVVRGGKIRQESVSNGLRSIRSDCSMVVIHDGVRPMVTCGLIEASIREARKTGAAVVAVPVKDTVKKTMDRQRIETLPREAIWLAQTPQTFSFPLIQEAYQKASREPIQGTDDAFLVERLGHPVTLVMGDYANIKITTPEDLVLAEALLSMRKQEA